MKRLLLTLAIISALFIGMWVLLSVFIFIGYAMEHRWLGSLMAASFLLLVAWKLAGEILYAVQKNREGHLQVTEWTQDDGQAGESVLRQKG